MRDMASKGRYVLGRKAKGEEHSLAQMSNAEVAEIRREYEPYVVTARMLAARFGVSVVTVQKIVEGWQRVAEVRASGSDGRAPAARKRRASDEIASECPHGHPYAAGNLLINSQGYRECRACRRERSRAHKAKRRTERKVMA
ncbi:MAG: transposase family protein [Actinomycetota bacterium]|nr:transposase family protein [Actinomycetota bacterium]